MMNLEVESRWDGSPCPDKTIRGEFTVEREESGLRITAKAPKFSVEHQPNAPTGTRFDGLWEFDVLEIFFVGENGKYIEIELGTAGHYLVLGFDGVRRRSNDFHDMSFDHSFKREDDGSTISTILIPNEILPTVITRANAFVIANQEFLSHAPLPGAKPDFHQPSEYPIMSV
jgi:hypothetical protein